MIYAGMTHLLGVARKCGSGCPHQQDRRGTDEQGLCAHRRPPISLIPATPIRRSGRRSWWWVRAGLMPNDEPGLPRNAYASEGFSMVGFCGAPKLPLQISEGREQAMKSDWGRGIRAN